MQTRCLRSQRQLATR